MVTPRPERTPSSVRDDNRVRAPRIVAEALTFQPMGADGPTPLRNLDLVVEPGELLLVAGPTGCGKSTLLDLVAGLGGLFPEPRAAGLLRVTFPDDPETPEAPDDPAKRVPAIRPGRVGHLHQEAGDGLVGFDVLTSLAMPLEAQGLARTEMAHRIEDALTTFGVLHLAHRDVATLSGGERKRVALASIEALDPPLVVLDEPLAHLDPPGVAQVVEDLQRLRQDRTVVIAEHRHAPLAPLVDRTLHLLPQASADRGTPQVPERHDAGAEQDLAAHLLDDLGADDRGGDTEGARLVVRNLSVTRSTRRLLDDVRMVLQPGVHGLLGVNGAGKTTLLETLAGLHAVDAGHVTVDGVPVLRAGRPLRRRRRAEALLRRRLQVARQEARETFFAPTVAEDLAAPLKALDVVGRPQVAPAVDQALAASGLDHLAGRAPQRLSGGESRRVQLLGALLVAPRVLFVDEPSHGLDAESRAMVRATLEGFAAKGGIALVATHEPELLPADTQWWFLPGDGTLVGGEQAMPGAPGPRDAGFNGGLS